MIVVTGGAGFIGSAVVWALNRRGTDNVLIVDHLGSSEKWRNLNGLRFRDYLDREQFIDRIERGSLNSEIESIVHMGACSSTTERDVDYLVNNNYRYTVRLLDWAVRHHRRIVYASSAATYGDGAEGFSDSTQVLPRLRPLNAYGWSKQLVDSHALREGWLERVAGVKFFNVYGPNEYHKGDMASVVFKAVGQIRESGSLALFKSYRDEYADGEQERDFVYVKDAVEAVVWLLEHRDANGLFNIGSGRTESWNDLAAAVFAAMDLPTTIRYVDMPEPLRANYQYRTLADLGRLRAAGCSVEFRDLRAGVKDYVQGYLLRRTARLDSLETGPVLTASGEASVVR